MSNPLTLCLALLAAHALISVALSILVVLIWRAGLERKFSSSAELLAMRLLPGVGGALVVFAVVLPAFLAHEPPHASEKVGPLLYVLAAFALLIVGDAIRRGLRAWLDARALLRYFDDAGDCQPATESHDVEIVNVPEPIVAVIGGWSPRIVASRRVVSACSAEELRQVIAHEVAHVSARDNLKCLLLIVSPDPLAWLKTGDNLVKYWRTAAEFEADERATGSDPHKRVALAAALVKVARLATGNPRQLPALGISVALEDVEGRVRQLLGPSPTPMRSSIIQGIFVAGLLLPLAALPLQTQVHRFLEVLVAFGR